jgi:hypothetical protein
MTISAPLTVSSGSTFTYRVVEHPTRLVLVFASGSGLAEHEVARFAPNADGTVAFVDRFEPLLNDPRLTEGTTLELATAYAEQRAESDDLRFAF